MRRTRKRPIKQKLKYAAVVEGQCEYWYIQMLKRNERIVSVDIMPEIPQKKKLIDQYEKVKELARHYDLVFWIIDFDVILKEDKESKVSNSPLQNFRQYYENLEKKYDNVKVIINNPCIEYWFLLHFVSTSRYFDCCSKSIKELEKYISKYKKTQGFFTKQDNDIYLRLKPYLDTAIKNAKKVENFDSKNVFVGICQMNRFFESGELKKITEK
ncbi:RloB domain-containing protein [Puteibacter caeruleilacunae]|nr:RloB domain-containing protein [Puteibacter caeruleilacunae]